MRYQACSLALQSLIGSWIPKATDLGRRVCVCVCVCVRACVCVCVFNLADQGIPSQLPSTSMMRMNAPMGSHKGDQAIRRTVIILSLDVLQGLSRTRWETPMVGWRRRRVAAIKSSPEADFTLNGVSTQQAAALKFYRLVLQVDVLTIIQPFLCLQTCVCGVKMYFEVLG